MTNETTLDVTMETYPPQNHAQEIISDGHLFVTRIETPTGWVYNSVDKGHCIMGSCFVPFPANYVPETLSDAQNKKLLKTEAFIEAAGLIAWAHSLGHELIDFDKAMNNLVSTWKQYGQEEDK